MNHTRNMRSDNAKVVLIFLVVFGHIIEPLRTNFDIIRVLWQFIYIIHMPVFVFLAGFYTNVNRESYEKDNVEKILIPFVVMDILYELLYLIVNHNVSSYITQLAPYWILWFLLSLFCFKAILKVTLHIKYFLIIAIFISILAGLVSDVGYALSLSRTLYFLPFFLFGHLMQNRNKLLEKLFSSIVFKVISIIFFIVLLVMVSNSQVPNELFLGSISYTKMKISNLTGIRLRFFLQIISTISIFMFLSLIPNTKNIMSTLGRRTLNIFILHGFIVIILNKITVSSSNINILLFLLISLTISALIVLILGSKFIEKIISTVFGFVNRLFVK